jgi:hypothetical protein
MVNAMMVNPRGYMSDQNGPDLVQLQGRIRAVEQLAMLAQKNDAISGMVHQISAAIVLGKIETVKQTILDLCCSSQIRLRKNNPMATVFGAIVVGVRDFRKINMILCSMMDPVTLRSRGKNDHEGFVSVHVCMITGFLSGVLDLATIQGYLNVDILREFGRFLVSYVNWLIVFTADFPQDCQWISVDDDQAFGSVVAEINKVDTGGILADSFFGSFTMSDRKFPKFVDVIIRQLLIKHLASLDTTDLLVIVRNYLRTNPLCSPTV